MTRNATFYIFTCRYLPSLIISWYNFSLDSYERIVFKIYFTMATFPVHAAIRRGEQPLLSPPVVKEPPRVTKYFRHRHRLNLAHTHIRSAFSKQRNLLFTSLIENFTISMASLNFFTLSLKSLLARSKKRRTRFCCLSKTRLNNANLGLDCCLETLVTPIRFNVSPWWSLYTWNHNSLDSRAISLHEHPFQHNDMNTTVISTYFYDNYCNRMYRSFHLPIFEISGSSRNRNM